MIQSAVVTMLMPASSTRSYRSTSGNTPWKVTQSGLAAMMVVDRAGRHHTDRVHADDLAGVPTDLVRRVAVQADQLQVRMALDPLDHLAADVAGGYLEHPDFVGSARHLRSSTVPPRESCFAVLHRFAPVRG